MKPSGRASCNLTWLYRMLLLVFCFDNAGSSHNDQNKSGLGKLGCFSAVKVKKVARYICALHLEVLGDVVNHVWAFSIAKDGEKRYRHPFETFNGMLLTSIPEKLFNVHHVALPMYQSDSGEHYLFLIASQEGSRLFFSKSKGVVVWCLNRGSILYASMT